MSDPIELASVHVALGQMTILCGVQFALRRGEVAVLLGASGCGKTTLLHALGGLLAPTRGRVIWEGRDVFALGRERDSLRGRTLGFVFQRHTLLPELTALENVQFPGRVLGIGESRGRAEELLAAVGLAQRQKSLPAELSGGEQQRVAIARALLCRPPFLLADEPTGNLDGAAAERVRKLLFALARERGSGLLVATHDGSFAAGADRVLRLERGQLREVGR
ncbi:MAG: ABC transporter ATP-binding protein [Puniceicoccales bacterium]|jgi:ABC-type lipoprotein export system ATPase subunit|nr:ABC transporter ATP-binding protein [Puniceicoccales bacterium]